MNRTAEVKPAPPLLLQDGLYSIIQTALNEDIGSGDVTTDNIIDEYSHSQAIWKAKQEGIIAGLFIGEKVFKQLDDNITWIPQVDDSQYVKSGDILVKFKGSTRALLTAERTALNFVQRVSGIATKTNCYTKQLIGTHTKILDTRKTLPGFRALDKYAVKMGGGSNHRFGLYDMALIKENHITAAGGIINAVEAIRKSDANVTIEVEATTLGEVQLALNAGADMIMFDNMSNEVMKQAVKLIAGKAKTEASGNITLGRLQEIAATGVDFISAGALTHSVEAFDISQMILK